MSSNVKTDKKDPNHLVIEIPKRKRPFEMPTKRQKDRSKGIPRDEKHKKQIHLE